MAWFGESLSSLTGHLQSLTKEVLSETSDESKDVATDLKTTKEKLEEVEAVCTAQNVEILALKKLNEDLLQRLEVSEGIEGAGAAGRLPPSTYGGVGGGGGRGGPLCPTSVIQHEETYRRELKKQADLVDQLRNQLLKVEEERDQLCQKTSELEQEIQQLKRCPSHDEEISKEKKFQMSEKEEKLIQENSDLRTQLTDAMSRTKELEEDLVRMQNQCLDHVIDSQVTASELRLDIEQTRKRVNNETGVQRAERLRAHQDMVNRMIQMGEKTHETEQNVKRLQKEERKLATEMTSKIEKLGDQEQQEFIHGTLKALELENQVLNMRNVQLERETLKDFGAKAEERKIVSSGMDHKVKTNDGKLEDDADNLSFQSELSEFILQNQQHESQILKLQNDVESYQKYMKQYELEVCNLSQEKQDLVDQIKQLKEQLEEREEFLNSCSSQASSAQNSQQQEQQQLQQQQGYLNDDETIKKLNEVEQECDKHKENILQLKVEKQCLKEELEAMARVVQDLEAKMACEEEEKHCLITNMEELDQQHQDALDKLLGLRKADQVENDEMKREIEELQMAMNLKNTRTSTVQTETDSGCECNIKNGKNSSYCEAGSQTESQEENEVNDLQTDILLNYDLELCGKIKNMCSFNIPKYLNSSFPQSLYLVEEIVKIASDNKWKKDTLERKVTELMRENNEYKSTITILEAECSNLKENVERLAEQLVGVAKSANDPLPTILENCEEMEQMEQRNAVLEADVNILEDAKKQLEDDIRRVTREWQTFLDKMQNVMSSFKTEDLQNDENSLAMMSQETISQPPEHQTVSNGKAQALLSELESCINIRNQYLQKIKSENSDGKKELLKLAQIREMDIERFENTIRCLESDKSSLTLELEEVKQKKLTLEDTVAKINMFNEEKVLSENKTNDLYVEPKFIEEVNIDSAADKERSVGATANVERELSDSIKRLYMVLIKNQKGLDANLEKQNFKGPLEDMQELESRKLELVKNKRHFPEPAKSGEWVSEMKEETEMSRCEVVAGHLPVIESEFLSTEVQSHTMKPELIQSFFKEMPKEDAGMQDKDFQNIVSEFSEKKQAVEHLQQIIGVLHRQVSDMNIRLQSKHLVDFSNLAEKLQLEIKNLQVHLSDTENIALQTVQQLQKLDLLKVEMSAVHSEEENLMPEGLGCEKIFSISQLREKIYALENYLDLLQSWSEKGREIPRKKIIVKRVVEQDNKMLQCDIDLPLETESLTEADLGVMSEIKLLREEKQSTLLLLQEKEREVDLLQKKAMHLVTINDENIQTLKSLEIDKENILKEKLYSDEKYEMTKETIANLSEMIREREKKIEELEIRVTDLNTVAQEKDNVSQQLLQIQEMARHALQERDQLMQAVHMKHQESVQYHAEVQRLSSVLAQELEKYQKLASEYTILFQSCEQQKANLEHQDEVGKLKDLIMVKDEGLQQLCKKLELKEQELFARGMELDVLRHQIESIMQERAGSAKSPKGSQTDDIQEKYDDLLSSVKEEQTKYKNLLSEFELCQGREFALQRELERLRVHLVEIEDMYTQEALKTEQHIKELGGKLLQAEEIMKSSSTVYKSANIRANQQVETLQEQARLIAQQRDDVQEKLSAAEDQVAKHSAALCNLQVVLEQFQRDKEREIEAVKNSVHVKVDAALGKNGELHAQILLLKSQLMEANEGLSAASRLGEELEKKTEMVCRLKQEVIELQQRLKEAEEVSKAVNQNVQGKIDKFLVKNVVLGFFLAPTNSQEQVLHVVANVLEFTEEEKSRVLKKLGLHGSSGSGSWFKSLLHPGSQQDSNTQSLSEAFVRFLENESVPQPKLKMLPEGQEHGMGGARSSTSSPRAATPIDARRKSPLLLADVQLPTFAQFAVSRNSSSILKDILKES